MRKEIKKWGNGAGIFLSGKELKLYNMDVGDIIDLTLIMIKRKRKEVKKNAN
jgi:antitoxin component of MazEF toxin-antitoxin module